MGASELSRNNFY